MACDKIVLAPAPSDGRRHELWLQHAASWILIEDVRGYAIARIDPTLAAEARAAAVKGIDDALYGLMQVIDGVSGSLTSARERVELEVVARHLRTEGTGETKLKLNLRDGDGMCMGYHGWLEGDFGQDPIVVESQPTGREK
jgi:hypothetical protein